MLYIVFNITKHNLIYYLPCIAYSLYLSLCLFKPCFSSGVCCFWTTDRYIWIYNIEGELLLMIFFFWQAMSTAQLLSFSTNQANAVTHAQYAALTAEQQKVVGSKATLDFTKKDDKSGGDRSSGNSEYPPSLFTICMTLKRFTSIVYLICFFQLIWFKVHKWSLWQIIFSHLWYTLTNSFSKEGTKVLEFSPPLLHTINLAMLFIVFNLKYNATHYLPCITYSLYF